MHARHASRRPITALGGAVAARDSSEPVRTVAFESTEPAAARLTRAGDATPRTSSTSRHAERIDRTDNPLPVPSVPGFAGFRLSTPHAAWSADRWLQSAAHVRLRTCRLVPQ